MRLGWSISKYVLLAVLPYFVFSWLLLSVILFVQQASRFSDIFFNVNIPPELVWQLSVALIPSVIAFTCPMAALVGVIIGLNRLRADNEITAIKAAGVGNFSLILPILFLGVFLSLFAFMVNLKGVPLAAGIVRQVALRSALMKLESPIEPGVFNTEVAGFTIYVKEGDLSTGTWTNIFIHNEDEKSKTMRLITAERGRIDFSGENSELVLENAISSTFTQAEGAEKLFSERIDAIRYSVKTKRSEVISKLNANELTADELGLAELAQFARSKQGRERTEAELLWQRRILLSITPLIFCLFGAALILTSGRSGRLFAVLSALLSLVGYYLLAFLGEQLVRTGKISVFAGGLIPVLGSCAVIGWLFLRPQLRKSGGNLFNFRTAGVFKLRPNSRSLSPDLFLDLTTGLRDFDLVATLVKYLTLSLVFLWAVFLIFTAFEHWKYAGTIDNGVQLLLEYLFYLSPFIYLQLAPSCALIATLATYVIKSRQNEIVTWTSSGQSVYRLLVPCFLLMSFLGFANWQIQERILPRANQIQDELRTLIRTASLGSARTGKLWVASNQRIYSFAASNASDNEKDAADACGSICPVKDLRIYEFSGDKRRLQSVYHIPEAAWQNNRIISFAPAEVFQLDGGRIDKREVKDLELAESINPFTGARSKPSHLNSGELRQQIERTESEAERRSFAVALQRKYATAFLPLVIALFTAPFSLSLSRTGKAATTGYAIGVWLVFTGVTTVFDQLGLNGSVTPAVAVWTPLMVFTLIGLYLLTKVRT